MQIDRALDPAERFFWLSDRVSCMNFVVFAELEGAIDGRALRAALDRAQRAHPLLRVRIATERGTPRFEPDDRMRIPLQERAVTELDWQAHIERELGTAFEPSEPPLIRCVCLTVDDRARSVLALTFHHSIADGRSGALLLRRILAEVLGGAPTASGDGGVYPPLHELFPASFRWGAHPDAAEAVYEQEMALLARYGSILPMPWLQGPAVPAQARFQRIALEREIVGRLVERARSQGTTVHGALGAAQLFALHRLWERPEPRTWLLSHPVDLRDHLDRTVPPDALGLYISILASPHRVDGGSDFWTLAREITGDLRAQLARGEAHLFYALQNLHEVPPGDEGVAWFGKRLRSMLPNVSLSNIGRVEAIEGPGRVRSISFALCPMPFQLAFCAVSTYVGRLVLNLAYDATKLSPPDAATFAASLRDRLATEAERGA